MGTLFIVVLVCLLAACIVGVGTFAWLGYGRVKAGFNIGRSGFYIEAADLSVQPSGGALPGSRDIADRLPPGAPRRRPAADPGTSCRSRPAKVTWLPCSGQYDASRLIRRHGDSSVSTRRQRATSRSSSEYTRNCSGAAPTIW